MAIPNHSHLKLTINLTGQHQFLVTFPIHHQQLKQQQQQPSEKVMRMACNEMTTSGKKSLIFSQILKTSCSRKMYGDQAAKLACGF